MKKIVMKKKLALLATVMGFLLVNLAPAQTIEQKKLEIDEIIRQANMKFERARNIFPVQKQMKKGEFLTEKFSYAVIEKEVEVLVVNSQRGDWSYEEFYYFRKKQLIYAIEREFFKFEGETNSVWSGAFYFAEGKLLDYSTNGHGKSETEEWEPETEVLQSSCKRIKQLNK